MGKDGSDDTGQVDIDVLAVGVLDGAVAGRHVVFEQNDGEEGAGQVERPVVALRRSVSEWTTLATEGLTIYATARTTKAKHSSLFMKRPRR